MVTYPFFCKICKAGFRMNQALGSHNTSSRHIERARLASALAPAAAVVGSPKRRRTLDSAGAPEGPPEAPAPASPAKAAEQTVMHLRGKHTKTYSQFRKRPSTLKRYKKRYPVHKANVMKKRYPVHKARSTWCSHFLARHGESWRRAKNKRKSNGEQLASAMQMWVTLAKAPDPQFRCLGI